MDNNTDNKNIQTSVDEDRDIFDKIMSLKIFKPFEPFYQKNKEVLMYLLFGGLTTVLAIVLAQVFKTMLENAGCSKDIIATGSTAGSWIVAVFFAYVTNKIWVFRSKVKDFKGVMKEMGAFCGGRLFTLVVDWGITMVFYSKLGFPFLPVKITANVVVVILNYIISKLIVFRNKPKDKAQ